MTKEIKNNPVGIINYKDLKESRKALKEYKPENISEAIKTLAFMSIISNADVASSIKKSCASTLENMSDSIKEYYDKDTDLTVTKITTKSKVYNTSEELEDLESEVSYLNDRINELKKSLGYTEVEGISYWKIK